MSFVVTSVSNVQGTLDSTLGLVSSGGQLLVTGTSPAVSMQGVAPSLIVNGEITGLVGVGGPVPLGPLNPRILVGETGSVTGRDDAIALDVQATFDLMNDGTILGMGRGMAVTHNPGGAITDGSSNTIFVRELLSEAVLEVANSGTIAAGGVAVHLRGGNGGVHLANTGTIQTVARSGRAFCPTPARSRAT